MYRTGDLARWRASLARFLSWSNFLLAACLKPRAVEATAPPKVFAVLTVASTTLPVVFFTPLHGCIDAAANSVAYSDPGLLDDTCAILPGNLSHKS